MTPGQLTWKHALGVASVVLVLVYAVLRVWSGHGHSMPQNSWVAVGVVLVMSGLLLYAGNEIRVYLRGDAVRSLTPQRARSTVVAAQACILGGAAFAGFYAAAALVNLTRLQTTTGPGAFAVALALTFACIGLTVSGLVVQWWCRVPEDDDEDSRRRRGGRPGPSDPVSPA